MSSSEESKQSISSIKFTMIWYSMLIGVGVMYFALTQVSLPEMKIDLGYPTELFSGLAVVLLGLSLFLGRLGSKGKGSEGFVVISWALAESISVLAYVLCVLGVSSLEEAQYLFLFSYLGLGINNPFLIKAKKKLSLDL